MPALSIITPVLNNRKYISSYIENVLAQKCTDLEHLIVDGGSTDGTLEIIKDYSQRYSHIRWISEKDTGQSNAMNKGAWLAAGKVIGFLNVDDFYAQNTLNEVLEVFKGIPECSFVSGNCNIWDENGVLKEVNVPSGLSITRMLATGVFPANASQYFYHKQMHEKHGFYKEDEHFAMDLEFILRLAMKEELRYINRVWGNFRNLPGTKTYVNMRTKEGVSNSQRIFRFYLAQLSLTEKVEVFVMRVFWFIAKIFRRILN